MPLHIFFSIILPRRPQVRLYNFIHASFNQLIIREIHKYLQLESEFMLRSNTLRQIRNKRNLFSFDQQPKSQVIRMGSQTKLTVNQWQLNQHISSPENLRESIKTSDLQTIAYKNRDFESQTQHPISGIKKQYEQRIIENLLKKFELDSLSVSELIKQVRQFVQFTQFVPKAKNIEGINILSNGIFHKIWAKLLIKQSPAHFESLRQQYYDCYNHAILENYQDFDDIFGCEAQLHQKNIEEEATYIQQLSEKSQYEHNRKSQPDTQNENFLMSENQQAQACLQLIGFNKQKQLDGNPFYLDFQQKDPIEKLSPQVEHHDEEDVYISLNYKLLKDRQNNERRRSAEMVCLFFGISFSTTFSSKQIEVIEVFQLYRQAKFQFSVFLAKRKTSKPNYLAKNQFLDTDQSEDNRIYITCYKLMNLQQLIRLELTYGKIYGFITYSQTFDFLFHLQEIKNNSVKQAKLEKLNENHRGTRRSNIKKYSNS